MIVCLCAGVSDKEIKKLVQEGHDTIEELADSCGAGANCGSCVETIERILYHEKRLVKNERCARLQLYSTQVYVMEKL